MHIIEGNSLSIRCNSTSYPSPSSYTWTFPGGSYNGQTVHISSVNRSRTGNHVCSITNTMDPTLGDSVTGSNNGTVDLQVLCKNITYFLLCVKVYIQNVVCQNS